MKILLFLILTVHNKILLTHNEHHSKERKLAVFPSYNEIIDVDEYTKNLEQIRDRIIQMRAQLVDVQNNAKHDVDYIVSKIDNRLQDDAYDDMLN